MINCGFYGDFDATATLQDETWNRVNDYTADFIVWLHATINAVWLCPKKEFR